MNDSEMEFVDDDTGLTEIQEALQDEVDEAIEAFVDAIFPYAEDGGTEDSDEILADLKDKILDALTDAAERLGIEDFYPE